MIMILAIFTDWLNRETIVAFVMINYVEKLAFLHLANGGDNDASIRQTSHDISDLTTTSWKLKN